MATKKVGARKAPAKFSVSGGKGNFSAVRQRAIAAGYNSGFEHRIAEQLTAAGLPEVFETVKIRFTQPATARSYTPDFPLPNGVVVETKGVFDSADRVKHKLIKKEHPDLDIRFVFERSSTKLSKGSPTTYGAWCDKHGFLYADKTIPQAWIDEPPESARLDALRVASEIAPKSTT